MTTTVTIAVNEFTASGPVALLGHSITFKPVPIHIDSTTDTVLSEDIWEVAIVDGVSTTLIPDSVSGYGVRIGANIQGWKFVTVANYPVGTISLADLVNNYAVNPTTLEPTPAPDSWWTALDNLVDNSVAIANQYTDEQLADVDADIAGALASANGYTDTKTAAAIVTAEGYTDASVAGLVPRTQFFHVSDFGAVGNGTTDDTAAIEAARVALVAQGGGALRFGPATRNYKVSKIVVSSNITYIGEGAKLTGNSATPEGVFQAQGWTDASTISDASIQGFIIDGGGLARRGVFLTKALRCSVTRNVISNLAAGTQDAIRLHMDTENCWVEDNHITLGVDSPFGTFTSAVGIYCVSATPDLQGGGQNDTLTFGTATQLSRGHVIRGNRVINGTHGISLTGAQDCRVTENRLESQTHRGIILSPIALKNVIAHNRIKDHGSTGIHLAWGSRWNTIIGNNLSSAASTTEGNGIKGYYGCSDNVVDANTIDGVLNGAIRFAMGSSRNVITSNRVNGSGTTAIGVQIQSYLPGASGYYQPATPGDATDFVISDNLITGCSKSIELEASAGNAAGVTGTILDGNLSESPTVAAYSIAELGTGFVSGVRAVNNVSLGTTTPWSLARGERHFSQKTANTGLIATPVTGFLRPGFYYQASPAFSITTANSLTNGAFRCAPLRVPNSITVTKVGLEVTAVGDTGSTVRLGIYADNGAGYPKTLVADLGTVAGDAIAVAELTVSLNLDPGTYWVGAVVQGVTTNQPTIRVLGVTNGPGVEAIPLTTGATPAANAAPSLGYAMLGVTGALPATFSASLNLTGTVPRIFIKTA